MQVEISAASLLIRGAFLALPVLLGAASYFVDLPTNQVSPMPLPWMRWLFGLLFAADLGVYAFLKRRAADPSRTGVFAAGNFWSMLLLSITVSPALYGLFLYLMGDARVNLLAFCTAAFLATLGAILYETLNPVE
jgi:hypothetical protein